VAAAVGGEGKGAVPRTRGSGQVLPRRAAGP
jgi:hypothetical protein